MASNTAAWLSGPRVKPLEISNAELPKPGPNEVVIKNHAVALNPVDWKIQEYGIFVQKYPFILGTDVAGEVHEVGEGVTHVKKGDRVIGHAFSLVTNDPRTGGFQKYSLINALVVAKIPDSLSYTSAAVLPLSISTASAVLFVKSALALPPPSSSTQKTNNALLIWGGSSSVGASAIQLAVGAGLKVIATAGKHNIQAVKELGASEVFDHRSPTVAEDIIQALQGSEYVGVADCVGEPASAAAWTPVFKKLGGRYASVMPEAKGIPEGVEGSSVFAPAVALSDRYVGEAVWAKYLPEALQNGTFKAKPDAEVITGGLEKLQTGLDQLQKGVSFKKLVVEL